MKLEISVFPILWQHSESEMFNKFLKDMKSDFIGTRYSAFWDKVVAEDVSLITSSESEDSSVTQDEAKQVCMGFALDSFGFIDKVDEVYPFNSALCTHVTQF